MTLPKLRQIPDSTLSFDPPIQLTTETWDDEDTGIIKTKAKPMLKLKILLLMNDLDGFSLLQEASKRTQFAPIVITLTAGWDGSVTCQFPTDDPRQFTLS